jgi:hypothetical protein
MAQEKKVYRGKDKVGRLRDGWDDGITMHFKATWWEGVDWVHLSHDADMWRAFVRTAVDL